VDNRDIVQIIPTQRRRQCTCNPKFHGSSFIVASSLHHREDVGVSGVSATMSRGCYEETASVEFMLCTAHDVAVVTVGLNNTEDRTTL